MASEFDNAFSSEVPAFLAEFAVTCAYTPQGSTSKNISVILYNPVGDVPFPTAANAKFLERRIKISSRSNTEGHTTPKRLGLDGGVGDTVVMPDSATWYVVDIEQNGAVDGRGLHTLVIRNKQIPMR